MTTVVEVIAAACVVVGAGLVFSAALGIVRMPDVFVRMHAATKAGTLGAGLMLIGVAVQSGEPSVVLRALAAVLFLIITAPVAAHLLGRAAYISGVARWSGTRLDDLAGKYEGSSHRLRAHERGPDGG